jgi:hypothetical protein
MGLLESRVWGVACGVSEEELEFGVGEEEEADWSSRCGAAGRVRVTMTLLGGLPFHVGTTALCQIRPGILLAFRVR